MFLIFSEIIYFSLFNDTQYINHFYQNYLQITAKRIIILLLLFSEYFLPSFIASDFAYFSESFDLHFQCIFYESDAYFLWVTESRVQSKCLVDIRRDHQDDRTVFRKTEAYYAIEKTA